VVCLPIYVFSWGWAVGGALVAVLIAGCYLLADGLLRRFRKVPFACAYPAWKQSATVFVLLYVLGLWAFASILPGLERALLLKSTWYLWGLAAALLAARSALRVLRRDDETNQILVFDEVPDAPFELLNLSGR
jgi:hypothetical protein